MGYFFCLTAENAGEFFERCVMAEAITYEERMKIMQLMSDEGKLMLAGELEGKAAKELEAFFTETKHKGIVMLKQKKGDNV